MLPIDKGFCLDNGWMLITRVHKLSAFRLNVKVDHRQMAKSAGKNQDLAVRYKMISEFLQQQSLVFEIPTGVNLCHFVGED